MSRKLGPICKRMRSVGTDLLLKSGVKPLDSKCKINVAPGMHGANRKRPSDYGLQLRAKQTLRSFYGILERPFRNYFEKASRKKGSTGENLLILLESRLDVLVYRMGFAVTLAEARQLVSHCSILVNNKRVNVASYQVSLGDTISVREKARSQLRIKAALELAKQRPPIDWIRFPSDENPVEAVFMRYPERNELSAQFNEQLVVELYSK